MVGARVGGRAGGLSPGAPFAGATPPSAGPGATTIQAVPVSDCGPFAEAAVVFTDSDTSMFAQMGRPLIETDTATESDPPGNTDGETVVPTTATIEAAETGMNATLLTVPAPTVTAEMT